MTDIPGFADIKVGSNLNEWLNEIAFVSSEMSDPSEPQTFQQAWWHPDLEAREKWHDGIRLEFNKMVSMDQQAFQVEGRWLDADGFSKLSAMESIEPDW